MVLVMMYYRVIDYRSSEEKIELIQKHFDDNPMIENGMMGFVSVNINNRDEILDDIKFGTYRGKYDDYKFIGDRTNGERTYVMREFMYQKYRRFVVVRYSLYDKQVCTREFEIIE